jgi:hypothetical protein
LDLPLPSGRYRRIETKGGIMERRTGVAIAGAVALILVAGGIAVGANLGLLGTSSDGPAGKLRPADLGPRVATVEVTDSPAPVVEDSEDSDEPKAEVVEVETPDDDTPEVTESPREDRDHEEDETGDDDGSGDDD